MDRGSCAQVDLDLEKSSVSSQEEELDSSRRSCIVAILWVKIAIFFAVLSLQLVH